MALSLQRRQTLQCSLIFLLALILFLASGCTQSQLIASQTNSENTSFNDLLESYWQAALIADTFIAGSENSTIERKTLPDLSPDHLLQLKQQWLSLRNTALKINDDTLSSNQLVSKQVLIYELDNRIDSYELGEHLMPLNSEWGFWLQIGQLPGLLDFNHQANVEIYLNVLNDIPRYIDQQIYWLQKGLDTDITQPSSALTYTAASIENLLSKDIFLDPFKNKSEFEEQRKNAEKLVNNNVIPALEKLLIFIEDEYIPGARQAVGYRQLPNGEHWYRNRVRYFATTDISPEEVHQLGLQEIARIHADMKKIIAALDFKGSFAEFLHFLRTDPQFYVDSPDQLLKEASYFAKRADGLLPRYFGSLPRRPYTVAPVPESIAPNYTSGRYYGPTNPLLAAEFWVNTYNLNDRPLYELPALTLHEAVPGHHLQISLTEELTHLPEFRRAGYISAFGEGWALYCEYLGEEAGFYETPYQQFGRLIFEAWRAARLVVDTGIHWFGWRREEAMQYMAENTGLSLHNVQTEVDRYITWPGQAISYKLGELKIRALRSHAEEALGDNFDIRAFHDVLLSQGSIPLSEMERLVDNFIHNHETDLSLN